MSIENSNEIQVLNFELVRHTQSAMHLTNHGFTTQNTMRISDTMSIRWDRWLSNAEFRLLRIYTVYVLYLRTPVVTSGNCEGAQAALIAAWRYQYLKWQEISD